jgi:solute:Na+ symporter, SSS family
MAGIDYLIIAAYLLVMVMLGVYFQKKGSSSINAYFLGERGLPWWLLGISGMASNLDVAGTMIITALLFSLGISGFFVEIRGGVVLILAFLMIFMGKWNRRAQVMTLAEWMHFRFGKRRDGDVARIISAISSIIMTIALVTYFCLGTGKFVTEFVRIPSLLGMAPEFWAALMLILLAMTYTVASGLYGVVYADAVRSVITLSAIIVTCFICLTQFDLPERFQLSIPVNEAKIQNYNLENPDNPLAAGSVLGEGGKYSLREIRGKDYLVWETTRDEWTSVVPPARFNFPEISDFSMFNLMLLAIFFYLIRSTLDGVAGSSGYMAQRYFAARSDREAGLLTLLWTGLLAFRWPFVAAIAIMGITVASQQGVGDPEKVLPIVVTTVFPAGLKGLLVAGLLAAAMSNFDSTINGGAAYWVKDIYHAYIRPGASEKQLVLQSRLASIAIVAVSMVFTLAVKNINEIWGFFTMGIMAGLFIPLVVRWFWWRLNGWGFAAGTGTGLTVALSLKAALPSGTPEFVPFLLVSLSALGALILVTLLTEQTDPEVLDNFYRKTRPFGFWGPVRAKLSPLVVSKINRENRSDILATPIAVCWQLSLFLTLMTVIVQRWDHFAWLLAILLASSIGLYYAWFRRLSEEIRVVPAEEPTAAPLASGAALAGTFSGSREP